MPWTPAYQVYGAEPVIRQLIGIINRDIQSALDFVSGSAGSLLPFAVYNLAENPTLNYPAILLLPLNDKFDPETNVADQTVQIYCAVAAEHQQPNQVAVLIQQYAYAVWHVLTAAALRTPWDFAAAGLALPASAYGPGQVTAGLPSGTVNRLFVQQPEFGELRQNAKSAFVKAAGMAIECDLIET